MEKHVQMLLFMFGVFMTSSHTQGWTDVPVEEGQGTILNCSLDKQDVIWYMQLLRESPVSILRTFSSKSEGASYYNETFKNIYSVKLGNKLFIHNVTLDKTRFYYFIGVLDKTTFLNETFRLVSASKLPMPNNEGSQKDFMFWPLVSLSLALNLFLITVLAARCHNRPSQPDSDFSPVTTSPGNPTPAEYEEIPMQVQDQTSAHVAMRRSSHCVSTSVAVAVSESQIPPAPTSGPDCVYQLLQLPATTPKAVP